MRFLIFALIIIFCMLKSTSAQQETQINFCGEVVPLENDFVKRKLFQVIATNKKNIDFVALRRKSDYYFPYIISQLAKHGIPEDFKYLPIIESGFSNATSKAGAHGFWQIMPGTATELGLKVRSTIDERNNVIKSTRAACLHIQSLYKQLGSWTLVACAYNFGLGNVRKTIKAQRKTDYYAMKLNSETALYLYRILAIKEYFTNTDSRQTLNLFNESTKGDKDVTFTQISVQVKSTENKFLSYIDRVEPKMATIFLMIQKDRENYFATSINDCDMFGFMIKKGTPFNLNLNKGDNKVYASIENLPDLILVDLSGKAAIDQRFFTTGLVVRVIEKE